MKRKHMLRLLMAAICVVALSVSVTAAQVDSDTTYCFSAADFAEEQLAGICITGIPDASAGTVMLGQRFLRSGDILTAEQVGQMTFHPQRTETDLQTQITYLPIYQDRVESVATMSIAVIGKTDRAPVAEDSAMETYKNLPNEAVLKVKDPEGRAMTFTVTRQPRRGTVVIREDGSFHYTPDKNKVGVDSFTYTATDPAGNVSREATVTITIMKPTDAPQYTDTVGESCRFAAEWMKHTGIFVSETIGGNNCFRPNKDVSYGEFVTMLVGALEMEPELEVSYTGEAPDWLKPYLAAAVRSGFIAGLPNGEAIDTNAPITGAEAAVMVQNALDLQGISDAEVFAPDWAADAVRTLADYGIALDAERVLTRADAAQVIYQVSLLAPDAPGTRILRITQ